MNVIIFYTNSDEPKLRCREVFDELSITAQEVNMSKTTTDDKNLLEILELNDHFFIVTNNETINYNWFHFICGYCLDNNYSLYLFFTRPDIEIAGTFKIFAHSANQDIMKDFYREELQIWTKKKEREVLLQQISDKGLYITPYHFFHCIEKNDYDAVELFLKLDYSPDTKNEKGVPAFNYAVRLNHNDIAKLLLEYRCDVHAMAIDNGNTSLMDAVAERNFDMFNQLLSMGIDLDIKSKNEQTALMLAVGRNDEQVVELLLKAGADVNVTDVLGMTAVMYANVLKYETIIQLLKDYSAS